MTIWIAAIAGLYLLLYPPSLFSTSSKESTLEVHLSGWQDRIKSIFQTKDLSEYLDRDSLYGR